MDNPYDLHSWSKRYREEALREAQARDLAGSSGRERRAGPRAVVIWSSLLSLLGKTQVAGDL